MFMTILSPLICLVVLVLWLSVGDVVASRRHWPVSVYHVLGRPWLAHRKFYSSHRPPEIVQHPDPVPVRLVENAYKLRHGNRREQMYIRIREMFCLITINLYII